MNLSDLLDDVRRTALVVSCVAYSSRLAGSCAEHVKLNEPIQSILRTDSITWSCWACAGPL